jgi:hypothetical protein
LSLFPNLPDRTRLFRLFRVHHAWTKRFLVFVSARQAETLLSLLF